MPRLGFYFEMERCIGCKACQVACKDKNNLEPGVFFRSVTTCEVEEAEGKRLRHFSGACNHCENPACIEACPTGATYQAGDGTLLQNRSKCIGCGQCIWACPYGAPSFSHQSGAAGKCDSCADLRSEGKQPACMDACVTHCLHFGELEKLAAKYGSNTVAELSVLPGYDVTRPALLIKIDKAARADKTECAGKTGEGNE